MNKEDLKLGGIIRRPFFIIAIFFAAGAVLGRYADFKAGYVVAAISFAALFCIIIRRGERKNKKLFAVLTLGAACLFFSAFLTSAAYYKDYITAGEHMSVKGRVYAQPYSNDYGSTVLLLDDTYINGRKSGNIKLYVSGEEDYECGDVVEADAEVEIPKGVRNPGGFDEKLYLLTQGISYKAYAQTAAVTGKKGGLAVLFSDTRKYIGDTIDNIFDPDVAPVAKAMLIGDKQGMDELTYTAFKDTGMAHVLAVSGLHAAILIAFVYNLLKLLKAGRKLRLIITLAFIAAYACAAGLTPSIVRAAIMACALLIGTYFGRQNDTLNYLSLAFVVSLLLRPLDLFTVGFQLSFAAVFGLLTLSRQIKHLWNKTFLKGFRRTGDAVSASAGATAGTLPILASSFNRISTVSLLINLIIIPLASAAIVLVFIAALFGLVFGQAAAFAAFPAAAVLRIMLAIIKFAADIPFAAIDTASPQLCIVLACLLLMYISSKYVLIKAKLKAIISGSIVLLSVFIILASASGGMYLVFLDTGQGDAAFLKTEQGGEYFIDGGNENGAEEVLSFTVRNGYKPDAAFLSHSDADHISGIIKLYEAGLLGKVYCSWQEKDYVKSVMPGAEVVPLCAGDRILLDEYTSALVLYPYKDTVSAEKNNASLILLFEYKGKKALFTGDISGVVETEIFAGMDRIDIYKAAHHGSKLSSYRLPLSVIRPLYSVVFAGGNSYGLPNQLAVANLEDYSKKVFITMEDMAIEFYINDKIRVNTYGGRNG